MVGIIIDLVGCAMPPTPFGVITLLLTRTPRSPTVLNFRSHSTHAASPINACPAALSTIKVSRRDSRGSSCPCRVLVVLPTPGSRTPDRLLTHSVQKKSILRKRREQFHPRCVVSLDIQPSSNPSYYSENTCFSLRSRARRSFSVPSPSMGFGDRRIDCLSCRETFARFRTAARDEKNPRSFRAAFLST